MIRAIQIIDSLQTGGAERVAVNYANGLVNFIDESHICVTRKEGPLLEKVDSDVGYLFLNKKSTLDFKAVLKLTGYIAKNQINIIHAHSSSFFIALLLKILIPKLKIVWHDHYGNSAFLDQRPKRILRFSSLFFSAIFSVNNELKKWAIKNLRCSNVAYIRNFPVLKKDEIKQTTLKGIKGKRIVCLANLREQKNQIVLLEAFKIVQDIHTDWTLHCIGKDFKDQYSDLFFKKRIDLNLEAGVHFYDSRSDIFNILNQCNIGILTSKSEGLPMALLEYGLVKLPVIVTDVGDCGLVVSDESLGILLNKHDKNTIANAILRYIGDKEYMQSSSKNLSLKISELYSANSILKDISMIYKKILIK